MLVISIHTIPVSPDPSTVPFLPTTYIFLFISPIFFYNPLSPFNAANMYMGGVIYWSMDNLLVAMTPKKNDCPSPRSYQLPIASQPGAGPHESLLHPFWIFFLAWPCVDLEQITTAAVSSWLGLIIWVSHSILLIFHSCGLQPLFSI